MQSLQLMERRGSVFLSDVTVSKMKHLGDETFFLYLAFVVNDLGVISHSNSPVKLSIFRQQIMQFTVIMGAEIH